MVKQRIELWTRGSDFKRKVQAVQYDSARILECAVMDASLPEGATAHFFAAKPSGKKVYLDCAVAGNTVSVELPDQVLTETGSLHCQIEIFDKSEKRVSSFEFILEVKKTLITADAVESTDAVTALKKYVDAAKGSADSAGRSESAAKSAQGSAEDARDKAKAAQTAAEAAQGKAETAKTGAETARKAAQAAQEDAAASKTAAAASATQAENWTNQSRSWTVGEGYPERSNQATDNSRYYASQAKAGSDAVQALSDKLTEIAGGDVVLHREIGAPEGAASLDAGGKVPDAQLGISDRTVTFEEAAAEENIVSGEKLSTLFGKIKKWLTGLPSSLAAKLNKAGDTMSGDLTFSGAERHIKYSSGIRTGTAISFYKGIDAGSDIVIGDGALTIVGGGESADALHTALSTSEGDENMHIGGDSSVFVYTACNSIANRKTFTFGTDGKLNTPAGTTQGSDRRLKSDICLIPEEQIEAFKNLSPKTYILKSSGRPGIGLIAQDVQRTALEDVLASKGDDGMLSIDYTNLHGLEIAVIQSLIKQVETLQTEISELKAHIKG